MQFVRDIFSSLINSIEKGITIDDHQTNRKRILGEIRDYMDVNTYDTEVIHQCLLYQIDKIISVKDNNVKYQLCGNNYNNLIVEMLDNGLINIIREDDLINDIIEISILNSVGCETQLEIGKESSTILKKHIEQLLGYASLSGSSFETEAFHELSRIIYYSLNIGILEKDYITSLMSSIVSKFSPHDWFRPGKVIYGLSFMLRSLIILCGTSLRDQFVDYLDVVRESLLKRMEIKREKMLCTEYHGHVSSFFIIEQLRYNIAVLEISVLFDDLRFLNTGLKSNDSVYHLMTKTSISTKKTRNNIKNILIALHYNKSINMQEEKYRALLCKI